jgi:hypothetical protein
VKAALREIPLALTIAVAAVGLVLTSAFERWRLGTGVMGLALCLAAAMRLTLPARQVGLLAVRTRTIDAAVLLALGFGLVVLANTIPTAS